MKGLPILGEKGIPLSSRILLSVLGFHVGFYYSSSYIRLGLSLSRFVRPMRPWL